MERCAVTCVDGVRHIGSQLERIDAKEIAQAICAKTRNTEDAEHSLVPARCVITLQDLGGADRLAAAGLRPSSASKSLKISWIFCQACES